MHKPEKIKLAYSLCCSQTVDFLEQTSIKFGSVFAQFYTNSNLDGKNCVGYLPLSLDWLFLKGPGPVGPLLAEVCDDWRDWRACAAKYESPGEGGGSGAAAAARFTVRPLGLKISWPGPPCDGGPYSGVVRNSPYIRFISALFSSMKRSILSLKIKTQI